ncbi:hypothetical protein J502_2897 [Acinetobacter sp. 1294596]|jgi:hypothetical protein|uniref:hypothetical protein n=1 Tax=Acinetobacter TaxID=469 RepID=UPI00044D9CC9|nr:MULTISPECIES: hypothetical protein [Acinetobacter]EXF56028.1 hypothetical protein J502_2897 [Acinetobacter sp. 1294596]MCK4094295.1 DNA-binding protein [Acinetobacter radioresistens]
MARLTKLARMSAEEKAAAKKEFEEASSESYFPPEVIALAFGVSEAWLQKTRSNGDGIPFSKPRGLRRVQYQKKDALRYFERSKLISTSA